MSLCTGTSATLDAANTGSIYLWSTGASTYKDTLTITLPACKFNTEAPSVSGPGVVDLQMDFDVYDDGSNQPVQIFYQTGDSSL